MGTSTTRQTLREELELQIERGWCAYCRRRGSPERPLTREHLIPRARGGGARDLSILAAACTRCNRRRGCQDLARFLLQRPRRIPAFLDYLARQSRTVLRQLDDRVLAEVYTAVWLASECALADGSWRAHLRGRCRGRRLHRRRYAARRLLQGAAARLQRLERRRTSHPAPACPLPERDQDAAELGEPAARLRARLLGLLCLRWDASPAEVEAQLQRELQVSVASSAPPIAGPLPFPSARRLAPAPEIERRTRRRKRSLRVDRRGGRAVRRAA